MQMLHPTSQASSILMLVLVLTDLWTCSQTCSSTQNSHHNGEHFSEPHTNWLFQWPLDIRRLGTIEAVFSDCLSIYHAVSSIGDNMWPVWELLVAGYTRSGRSYHVIFARVSSLCRGCGKNTPRVVEQPFVMVTCNLLVQISILSGMNSWWLTLCLPATAKDWRGLFPVSAFGFSGDSIEKIASLANSLQSVIEKTRSAGWQCERGISEQYVKEL